MDYISSFLFGLLSSSGGVYLIGRKYGEGWIKSIFEKEIVRLKEKHAQELSKIKDYRKAMLNRADKVHEHEFTVLPEAWRKILKAFFKTGPVINGQIENPILIDQPDNEVKLLLEACGFSEKEIASVLQSDNMIMTALKIQIIKAHDAADKSIYEASEYLTESGIFIRPEIAKELEGLIDDLGRAIAESRRSSNQSAQEPRPYRTHLVNDGIDRIKRVEKSIRDRLWNAEVYGTMLDSNDVIEDAKDQ